VWFREGNLLFTIKLRPHSKRIFLDRALILVAFIIVPFSALFFTLPILRGIGATSRLFNQISGYGLWDGCVVILYPNIISLFLISLSA